VSGFPPTKDINHSDGPYRAIVQSYPSDTSTDQTLFAISPRPPTPIRKLRTSEVLVCCNG